METNKNNAVVTVSEDTNEIYEIRKELMMLRDKVDRWYEKVYGCSSNKECNEAIMYKFYEKSFQGFCAADDFIMELLLENIKENIYEEEAEL